MLHVFYGVPTTQKWPFVAAQSSRGAKSQFPCAFLRKHTICHVQFGLQKRYTLHNFTASQPRKNGRCLAKKSQNTQFATFNLGCKKFRAAQNFFIPSHFPRYTSLTASQPRKNGRCLAKNSQNTQFATFNLQKVRAARIFFIPAISHVTRFLRRPNHAKMAVAWPKKVKTHNLPRLIWAAKSSRGANFILLSQFPCYTFLRRPNHAKLTIAWPKTVKTHNFPRSISAAKSSRGANFFHPQPFPMLYVFYGVPTTQKWPSLGQKKFKTHNLPRLIWAAKSSRGANFFHPSHFTRYTSFTASQPRKNGRCLAKKSQNTQFATFILGCKNFARRKIFSSPAISHVTRPNHAKMAAAWPKTVKTHGVPTTQKWPLLGQKSQNTQFATFNLGCKKFARRKLYSPQPIPLLHVFTASQSCKIDHCLAKNSQNTQFSTFNFSCKKFARRKLFSSPALSHVIRLLRRPNHAKMAVAWPKKFKTHNLPRLIWAAKSSRGANFFHPSHFTRYTSFTASQPRKNGRCLAKKSQNTQFATFNLGCKNFARRKIFSSPAISHVTRFLRRPNHAKMAAAWPKTVKTHNLPRLISAAKSSRGANFILLSQFLCYTFLRHPNHAKLTFARPKTVKTHNLPRSISAAKSSRGANFFHPQPFPMLYVFYGVPTTQKWPSPGQKNSKHTICHA